MSREILFRGKCEKEGDWHFGYLFRTDSGVVCILEKYIPLKELSYFEVDPDTLCQYTEVDDKNGTNIFHKDIVSALFTGYGGKKHTRIGVVEYLKGAFCVNWNDSEEYGKNFLGYVNDIEVIGNMLDNPELIQK